MGDPFNPLDPSATTDIGGVRVPAYLAPRFVAPQPAALNFAPDALPQPVAQPPVHMPAASPTRQFDATGKEIVPDEFTAAAKDKATADEEAKQAAQQTADVTSVEANQEADVYHEANRKADLMRAQQEKQLHQDIADQKTQQAELASAQNQYANTKVDQNRFWHDSSTGSKVLMGIGLALSAAGQAFSRGQTNSAALEIIQNAIKQDVQLQLADREKLGVVVGQKGQALDRLMQATKDRQATYLSAIGASYDYAKKQIEEIAAKTQDPLAQAKAKELAATIDQQSAMYKDQAAGAAWQRTMETRKQAEQERANRANEGVAYGHLALANKQFAEGVRQFDLNRQDNLDAQALAYEKAGQTTLAAKAKEQAERGLFDPSNGNAILNPEAKPMLDKAAEFEKAAKSEKDPAKQAQLVAAAKAIRDQAVVEHGFTVGRPEDASKLKEQLGATQNLMNTLAEIRRGLDQDPNMTNRAEWARLSSLFNQAKVAYIQVHGAKPSSREMQAVEEVFGTDPSGIGARVLGMKKMRSYVDTIDTEAQQQATTDLKAQGYRGEFRLLSPDAKQSEEQAAYKGALAGKTSVERASAAEKGIVGAQLPDSDLQFRTNEMRSRQAENAGPIANTAMTPSQEQSVKALITASANEDKRDSAVSKLVVLATSSRESVANSTLSIVKAQDPKLYQEILAKLPAEQRKQRETFDAAKGGPAVTLDPKLVSDAKRVARTGTPEQRKAAIEIVRRFDPQGAAELEGK